MCVRVQLSRSTAPRSEETRSSGGGLRGWFSSAKDTIKHVLYTGEFSRPPRQEQQQRMEPSKAAYQSAGVAVPTGRAGSRHETGAQRDEVMLAGVQMTD